MEYTVLELFSMIVHNKKKENDFYQEDMVLEVEDYLEAITNISPEEKIVIDSDCHEEPLSKTISINSIANKIINVDGIMIFYYIWHDNDFTFEKIENYHELYNEMKAILNNGFYYNLIVFKDGKKKDYCVKGEDGQILHRDYDTEWLQKFEHLKIEWL